MLSIYDYIDIGIYLSDVLKEKKLKNDSFSLRAWAKVLGMKSHGPLYAMLNGKRNIPKKFVPILIKNLNLNTKEAKFFELLVDLSRSKSVEEKEFYLEKLSSLSPKELREVSDIEAYKYITEPLHIIIAEMTELKDFKYSLGWIKNRLRKNVNLREIEEILERLMNLGLLKKQGQSLKKQVQHIYTAKEVMSKAVQEYHKKMGQLAIEEISRQEISIREFNAISFNIDPKDIIKIKEQIREFSDELVQNFEAKSKKGSETYHLNVQFFSLTK